MQSPLPVKVQIPVSQSVMVLGSLFIPVNAKGLVIFCNGREDGISKASNKMVADYLAHQNFATLRLDTQAQEIHQAGLSRSTIRLHAEQLVVISEWLLSNETTAHFHQAYFSEGAATAAAVYAAAAEGTEIAAIVSYEGQLELAMEVLPALRSPTLLMVSSKNNEVLQHHQRAFDLMHCPKRLQVIPVNSHLLEDEGVLEKICVQTSTWLEQYLHPIRMISK